MDNKQKKHDQRLRERNRIILFIISLIAVLAVLIFMNKRFYPKIEHEESSYEEDVKTYEGSLNRNITNPFGSD